jgi:hypothetical protein
MGTQVGLINLAFTLNLKVPAAREESGDGVARPGPAQHVIDPTLRREYADPRFVHAFALAPVKFGGSLGE